MKASLNSTHLSCIAQQCKLQVWVRYVRIPSKLLSCQILSWFGDGVVLASCSIKIKGVTMVAILSSSSTKRHGKHLYVCPTFDFKQSPYGR
jgi:hypothetical protein